MESKIEFEEPVVWFEGVLLQDAKPAGPEAMQLYVRIEGAATPRKVVVGLTGTAQTSAARLAGRKGVGVMVKGRIGDEGTGVDVIADSIAFDPRHAAPAAGKEEE